MSRPLPSSGYRGLAGVLLLALLAWVAALPARAQTYLWDASGTNPNNPAGGTGTWTSGGADWTNTYDQTHLLDVALPTTAWAQFTGAAGTVTLGNAVTAQGLIFTTSGYVLTGANALTLATGALSVASGVTAEVDAPLAGGSGLVKSGAGTLTLGSSASIYTGTTLIRAGTVQVTSAVPAGGNGPLGSATGAIALGDASIASLSTVAAASTGNVAVATSLGSTLTSLGLATLDGVALANGNTILLKNQTTASQNGLYTYSYALGIATLTRVTLTANGNYYGDRVAVTGGATQAGTSYFVSDPGSLTSTPPPSISCPTPSIRTSPSSPMPPSP